MNNINKIFPEKQNPKKGSDFIASIVVRFVNWVFNSKFGFKLPSLIKKLYKQIRKNEFQLTQEIIHVKKGKLRYTLIIFETENQKYRVNIGRHKDDVSAIL